MSSTLMKSISGIRGILGDSFTPELITDISAAFAQYCKSGTIIIGRDSRPSGEIISEIVKSVVAMCGLDIIDIGVVPTPTVQVAVEELNASGGIVISASHNPIEWNAFKLINRNGLFLNSNEISKFFKILDNEKFKSAKWDKIGTVKQDDKISDIHIKNVKKVINLKKIKQKKFNVVLDSVNGAGSIITQDLLSQLGCKIIAINCTLDGKFPRGPEPSPENLDMLKSAVVKKRADIGFAQDPDADRLAIVDENGRAIGEEYTLALVTEHLLSKKTGRVVTNLSTTKAVEDIAKKYKSSFKRTKVGEINVADDMRKNGARIGGEGNGGIISPEVHLGRDSLVGIAYILEMMSERRKTLSQLVSELPQYFMKKGKVKFDPSTFDSTILDKLQKKYKEEKISTIDGLRIDFKKDEVFKGGWVHLRSSNTEPIFRIITEGLSQKQADQIFKHFAKEFK